MGCTTSSHFVPNPDIPGQGKSALLVGFDLGYTLDDINKLYKAFNSMDVYGRGIVAKTVFATTFKFKNQEVSRFIAKPFDTFSNSFIDFEEFIIACWSMLTIKSENLWRFAFNLIDVGNTKSLTREESQLFISTFIPPGELRDEVTKASEDFLDNSRISIDSFSLLVKRYPTIAEPLDDIYEKLREGTLGWKRWNELMHARAIKYEDKSLKAIIRQMRVKPSCATRVPVVSNPDNNGSYCSLNDSLSVNVDAAQHAKPQAAPGASSLPFGLRSTTESEASTHMRRSIRQSARSSMDSNPRSSLDSNPSTASGFSGPAMFNKSLSARLRLKLKLAQMQQSQGQVPGQAQCQGQGQGQGLGIAAAGVLSTRRVYSSTEEELSGPRKHLESNEDMVGDFMLKRRTVSRRQTFDEPPRMKERTDRAERRRQRHTFQ